MTGKTTGVKRILPKTLDQAVFRYIPLLISMSFVLFPFYWTVVTALKREQDIVKTPVKFIPDPPTAYNILFAWNNSGFSVFFKNTLFVSLITAVIVIILSILASYGLSRFIFKGKKSYLLMLLVTQLIPSNMLIIPLFIIFKNLGLISTLSSLIITYITFQLPFNAILMKSFIDNVPYELEEAGMIDGCSRMGGIFRVVLPLLVPGTIAIGAFAFLGSWNEFIFPVMLVNRKSSFVISVGLNYMMGQNVMLYGALAAGSLIALSVPVLIFAFMQRYLVQGLSAGAVKG